MKKGILSILTVIISYYYVSSQENVIKCFTDQVVSELYQTHPGYQQAYENTFLEAKSFAEQTVQYKQGQEGNIDTIYRIPVVVHIVYNTPDQNLHDSIILNQIDVLNRDFRRNNEDTINTRAIFKPLTTDAGIEFYLATTDPAGNPTNGITRTMTSTASFGGGFDLSSIDEVKSSSTGGINAWPTNTYLNIWVCNMQSILGQILGFAYPPTAAPNWPAGTVPTDTSVYGVVVHYEVFGGNNPLATGLLSTSDQGRTCVHEVGHYLGLRHIWGDGFFDGCSEDDGIEDTPNAATNSQFEGCDFSKNTCGQGQPGDHPDMVENYMDYSTETCQNMFTKQQINLMRAVLVVGRPDLADVVISSDSVSVGIIDRNNATLHSAFTLYPNPSNNHSDITIQSLHSIPFDQIIIYDPLGKTVKKVTWEDNQYTRKISLKGITKGVYVCTVYNDQNPVSTKKLILSN